MEHIVNSEEFKQFMKNVRDDPCRDSYSLKVYYSTSDKLSPLLEKAITEHGFKINSIIPGKHADKHLHNGRVELVPCVIVDVKPTENMRIIPESFMEKISRILW